MSSGTITVTNKSDKVVGVGTAFTTDLKAGDVMVMPVGAGSFTLIVKSIESATGLTLMEPFRGPTLSGQSWDAVPYEAMLRINAQLSTQTGVAIYGLNLDKQNWQAVFSDSGDITVILPDGSSFSGPSWKKIAELLAESVATNARIGYALLSPTTQISVPQRVVLDNPFGNNTPVLVQAELLSSTGKWFNTGWAYNGSNNESYGINASYSEGEGIVIQTGSVKLNTAAWNAGGGGAGPVAELTTGNYRVRVTKVTA